MKTDYEVFFKDWRCTANVGQYANGRMAITLTQQGCRIAVATVNLPHVQLGPGEVFIKDWSENRGMLEALKEAGIVEEVIDRIPTGFAHAEHCRLTSKFTRSIKEEA